MSKIVLRSLFGILLFLSSDVFSQEFAPIYENLNRLESIMSELQTSNENMTKDNESLRTALENLNGLLEMQGQLLGEQQTAWEEARKISARQAHLLGTYISKSRKLRIYLIVGLPVAAGIGILTGVLIGSH